MSTKASSDVIEQRLTNLFPSEALENHAEAVGVIEREGNLQIPALVWSFAFGSATGESRTLAAFRRSYRVTLARYTSTVLALPDQQPASEECTFEEFRGE